MARPKIRLHLPSTRLQKHVPTKVTREHVSLWAQVGTAKAIIANELKISVTTLDAYYGAELLEASERGVAKVAAALYAKAISGDTTAMIHFLRVRGKKLGWADKEGDGGQTTNILQLNLVKSITQAVSHMRQQGGEAAQMLIEQEDVLPTLAEVDHTIDEAWDIIGQRA